MPRKTLYLAILVVFCAESAYLRAQDFTLLGREVQLHGFASQAYVKTDVNNWLTMDTSDGSAAFTDFGVNLSTHISDKLFVGGQLYDRNLGHLGQYHPSLDWAVADYRFKNWLGVRGGKVRTTLGLYNATQDQDFLRVFALLPQSVYPADLRDATIAHLGGDVYGMISLRRNLGSLSYTVYAGHRSDSIYSGYPYLLSQFGTHFSSFGGLQYGADLRWNTPAKGLLIGASRLDQDTSGKGTSFIPGVVPPVQIPYSESSKSDWMNQFYGEYTHGKLCVDSEYRRYYRNQNIFSGASTNMDDVRGWYVSGTYRVAKRLQVGSYYSRYAITSINGGYIASLGFPNQTNTSLPANHIYDKVISGQIELKKFWNLKLEGHFMNGYGDSTYPDGFYPQVNPQGFNTNTNAFILRTSVYF
jgi:hypothetical protein